MKNNKPHKTNKLHSFLPLIKTHIYIYITVHITFPINITHTKRKKKQKKKKNKMTKAFVVVALVATTLSFCLSIVLSSEAAEHFFVEGRIYCDTCRVQFVTRVSEPLEGM